jgi:hypothetical protein
MLNEMGNGDRKTGPHHGGAARWRAIHAPGWFFSHLTVLSRPRDQCHATPFPGWSARLRVVAGEGMKQIINSDGVGSARA